MITQTVTTVHMSWAPFHIKYCFPMYTYWNIRKNIQVL